MEIKLTGLPVLLFIVFLVLKLTNVIDWSWWWVTSPIWLPIGLGLAFLGLGTVIGVLMVKGRFRRRRRR